MPNPENIEQHEFKKGETGNPNGRPKGAKNRSTIARAIMEMKAKLPEETLNELKLLYPDMTNDVTIEEAMGIMQAAKAIQEKDTAAYKVLMDSAYGQPKQTTDITTNGENITPIEWVTKSE